MELIHGRARPDQTTPERSAANWLEMEMAALAEEEASPPSESDVAEQTLHQLRASLANLQERYEEEDLAIATNARTPTVPVPIATIVVEEQHSPLHNDGGEVSPDTVMDTPHEAPRSDYKKKVMISPAASGVQNLRAAIEEAKAAGVSEGEITEAAVTFAERVEQRTKIAELKERPMPPAPAPRMAPPAAAPPPASPYKYSPARRPPPQAAATPLSSPRGVAPTPPPRRRRGKQPDFDSRTPAGLLVCAIGILFCIVVAYSARSPPAPPTIANSTSTYARRNGWSPRLSTLGASSSAPAATFQRSNFTTLHAGTPDGKEFVRAAKLAAVSVAGLMAYELLASAVLPPFARMLLLTPAKHVWSSILAAASRQYARIAWHLMWIRTGVPFLSRVLASAAASHTKKAAIAATAHVSRHGKIVLTAFQRLFGGRAAFSWAARVLRGGVAHAPNAQRNRALLGGMNLLGLSALSVAPKKKAMKETMPEQSTDNAATALPSPMSSEATLHFVNHYLPPL